MSVNVYFHIDELGRDAVTASALKKAYAERGINLIYGNRFYTKRLLEKFIFAFDLIILPRPLFLKSFKDINKDIPPIVILLTESVGRVVNENNDKFTLYALLDKEYMEGDEQYVDKVTAFYLWGFSGKRRIDKYYPDISDKFHVVGHPRHDYRCIEKSATNSVNEKNKIGLITRQPLLNDFYKRSPVEALVSNSLNLCEKYSYYNSNTGDFLLLQNNDAVDEMYLESADIEIIIKLILQLNKEGHEVYLKVHPREDRELWVGFVKKYNLNVTLAHWRVPFSHWVSELDYVIGPSSTSFYDCCVAGVQPICTRKINKNRDLHINKFSEEYGALMEYIVTPESIDEIIDFVCEKNESFDMNNEIKQVLLNETNYPDSNNSIDKMVELSLASMKENKVSSLMKTIYMIGFNIYGSVLDNAMKVYRFLNRRAEQSSTFLMTKKNRAYIDSLID
jgi:hypothetical protein